MLRKHALDTISLADLLALPARYTSQQLLTTPA
jgi:hypothetical protein